MKLVVLAGAVTALLSVGLPAFGQTTLDLDAAPIGGASGVGQLGNVGGWTVTAAGAVNAVPYNVFNGYIGLSSNGNSSGTPVAGASTAAFDGVSIFQTTFSLPSDATGVTLTYNTVSADDRYVFELNGNVLQTSGIFATTTPQPGSFVFTFGGPETPVTYVTNDASDADGVTSGTDTDFFNLGGLNALTMIVNSTGDGIGGGLETSDFKLAGMSGNYTVTYDGVAPEPSSCTLAISGLGLLGVFVRRRKAARLVS